MALPVYRGFSTANFLTNRTMLLTGVELVKRDLLNHIYTIPGERVHLPNFGTRIPLLAFEPLDQRTISIVKEDLRKVIEYDPRIRLIDMAVTAMPDNNAIAAFVDLEYLELAVSETLHLEFPVNG
jgi:phage baseplate assembly protein W